MKVKIGNKTTTLPKSVVASHMSNLLTTRDIIMGKEKDFKNAFLRNLDLCLIYLRENKKFAYSFGDEDWLDDYLDFHSKQRELLLQDVLIKFSDGSVWTISLHDIASLKLARDPKIKENKMQLLENPIKLVEWAQEELQWNQISNFATLKNIQGNEDIYKKEWKLTNKKVIKWSHQAKEN
jgi:hypothetical protein